MGFWYIPWSPRHAVVLTVAWIPGLAGAKIPLCQRTREWPGPFPGSTVITSELLFQFILN